MVDFRTACPSLETRHSSPKPRYLLVERRAMLTFGGSPPPCAETAHRCLSLLPRMPRSIQARSALQRAALPANARSSGRDQAYRKFGKCNNKGKGRSTYGQQQESQARALVILSNDMVHHGVESPVLFRKGGSEVLPESRQSDVPLYPPRPSR